MNLKELVDAVSADTGMAAGPVKKVLDATISTLNKQLQSGEPVKLQGLGVFKQKTGKEGKEPKTVFRPWPDADQKRSRKAKRKEKKAKKAGVAED